MINGKEKDESIGGEDIRGFVIKLNEEEEAVKKEKRKKKADGSRGWKRVGLLFCHGQRSSSYNYTTRVPVFAKRRKQSPMALFWKLGRRNLEGKVEN